MTDRMNIMWGLLNAEIVAQVEDAEKALEAVEKKTPDLMIIDISLPGMSGIELTKQIKQKYPGIKILIATAHDPEAYLDSAKKAGADDFIQKGDAAKIREKVCGLLGIERR